MCAAAVFAITPMTVRMHVRIRRALRQRLIRMILWFFCLEAIIGPNLG